jgi:hypothetical protein
VLNAITAGAHYTSHAQKTCHLLICSHKHHAECRQIGVLHKSIRVCVTMQYSVAKLFWLLCTAGIGHC